MFFLVNIPDNQDPCLVNLIKDLAYKPEHTSFNTLIDNSDVDKRTMAKTKVTAKHQILRRRTQKDTKYTDNDALNQISSDSKKHKLADKLTKIKLVKNSEICSLCGVNFPSTFTKSDKELHQKRCMTYSKADTAFMRMYGSDLEKYRNINLDQLIQFQRRIELLKKEKQKENKIAKLKSLNPLNQTHIMKETNNSIVPIKTYIEQAISDEDSLSDDLDLDLDDKNYVEEILEPEIEKKVKTNEEKETSVIELDQNCDVQGYVQEYYSICEQLSSF